MHIFSLFEKDSTSRDDVTEQKMQNLASPMAEGNCRYDQRASPLSAPNPHLWGNSWQLGAQMPNKQLYMKIEIMQLYTVSIKQRNHTIRLASTYAHMQDLLLLCITI